MTLLTIIGIFCGALCALSHSLCYLSTRGFLVTPGRSSYQLISLGHVYMGALALAGLPFYWLTPAGGWGPVALPLAATAGFYFAAQFLFFKLVTWAPASRISPLLGMKIIPLAGGAILFTGAALGPAQWGAVGLCLFAALVLARGGGDKLSWKAIAGVILTTFFYSMSDIGIARTMLALSPDPAIPFQEQVISSALLVRISLMTVSLTYLVCALPGIYWLLSPSMSAGRKGWPEWRGAFWYSMSWYAAMIFLFIAIALIGVVPAVMLQAARGPLSVGLGLLVAALGHHQLEKKLLWADAVKYSAGALLMCLAIVLYFIR